MKPYNYRALSERDLKHSKLSPSLKIGPRTQISPPRVLPYSMTPLQNKFPPLQMASQKKTSAPSDFLSQLIQKYSSSPSLLPVSFLQPATKMPKPKALSFSWSPKQTYGSVPSSRVNSTMVMLNNKLYIFGGQTSDRLNELKVLNYESLHWENLVCSNLVEMPEPRDGHTFLVYKQLLVVYGGAGSFNTLLHSRTASPLVHFFDTQNHSWQVLKALGNSPSPRRNHGSIVVGFNLIVYGGISNENLVLQDLHFLDFESMYWFVPKISKESTEIKYRHSFTMTAVFHPAVLKVFHQDFFNLPQIFDENFTKTNSGVYVFGGMNSEGEVFNDLLLMQPVKSKSRINKKVIKIEKIEASGKRPVARYGHSMGLCGKYLVLVGGRNDFLYVESHKSTIDEISAYNVVTNTWEKVECPGNKPKPAWGIASACFGTRMICFGGMNFNSFVSNQVWVLETNQEITEGLDNKKKEHAARFAARRNTNLYK